MDDKEDLLLVLIYILSVHIGEILVPNSLLSWTQEQSRGKLDRKVVEGWAIGIENGHMEIQKGSGSVVLRVSLNP